MDFLQLPKGIKVHPIWTEIKILIPPAIIPAGAENNFQDLFCDDSSYYASIDGTGYLFKIEEQGAKQIFRRIDTTFFTGYNYDDIKFSWNNKHYSYGGYGFWKHNGLIRVFNPKSGQWDLLLMEKEIPAVSSKTTTWLQKDSGFLYVYNPFALNDGLIPIKTNVDTLHLQVWRINLHNGACSFVGKGRSFTFSKLAETPWGMLCNFNNKELGLIDFLSNRVRPLKLEVNKKYLIHSTALYPNVKFFSDSTLYMANTVTGKIDSLQFSLNDFENSDKPLFDQPEQPASNFQFMLGGLLFIVLAIGAGSWYRIRKKKKYAIRETSSSQVNSATPQPLSNSQFSIAELNLLKLLMSKQLVSEGVGIEDLNLHFGIKFKNESVQKKIRSENLNHLNNKLKLLLNSEEDLILKQRSETDKRSYTYWLHPSVLEILKKIIL